MESTLVVIETIIVLDCLAPDVGSGTIKICRYDVVMIILRDTYRRVAKVDPDMSFHVQDVHNYCGNYIFVNQAILIMFISIVVTTPCSSTQCPPAIFCGMQVGGLILRHACLEGHPSEKKVLRRDLIGFCLQITPTFRNN